MSLRTTWEALRPFLLGERDVEETSAALGGADPVRLALYRRFVARHERDSVEKIFSATMRRVASAHWDGLVAEYFRAHPLSDWEFNGNAKAFPDFLVARHEAGDTRVDRAACELAVLEWTVFTAELDEAEIPSDGPLQLNPTVSLRQFTLDVAPFVADASRTGEPEARERLLLFFRHPDEEDGRWTEADAQVLLVLKMLSENVEPAAASQASGVPEVELRGWLEDGRRLGWIVGGR